MQLRTKFALVLLAVALVLSGATFSALEFYKGQAVGQLQENVDQRADLTAAQVSRTIRDRRDYVGLYASRPSMADFSRSEERLATFLNNSRFNTALIIAANGTVVDSDGLSPAAQQRFEGRNLSGKPYVQAALGESATPYVAEPAYDPQFDQWVVSMSAPIYGANGSGDPVGVFVASTALSPAPAGSGYESVRVFDAIAPLETNTSSVAVTAVVDGEQRSLYDPHRTFDRNVTGRAMVGATGWRVTVTRDWSVLQQRLGDLAILQGASILVVLVTVISLGIWEYRTNLTQTERLLEGFDALQRGQFEHDLELRAAEEWRKIGEGFNELGTNLREREQAIREREQRLEVLNRVLRHNLKNDMSVIMNYAALITDRAESDALADAGDTISEMGQKLVTHGQKARRIEDVMSGPTERERVDVVTAVEDALADLEQDYPDVTVTTDVPETAPALALPSLEFAIDNVCENACEHNTSDEPHVRVTVEQSADEICLTVADNGPGIPDHETAVLEAREETALEHGSGVGLWLVHWVVTNSDGDLTFAENDPQGTVVTITLATADAAPMDGSRQESTVA